MTSTSPSLPSSPIPGGARRDSSSRSRLPRRGVAVLALVATLLVAACGAGNASPAATAPTSTTPSGASPASTTPASASPAATAGAFSAALSAAGSTNTATTALVCTSPATPTISVTEGPYYKAGAPLTSSLYESGMTGTRLTLAGYVVNTSCQPLANAKVDIWQADASGQYDNGGYRLRGYVLTDASGRFTFETVIPGEYPGRTEHIHVKVTPSGGSTLTSQLFFPGQSASNDSDSIYDPSLLLTMTPNGSAYLGTFTFVVKA